MAAGGSVRVKYVSILRSRSTPERRYGGCTINPKKGFAEYNAGQAPHPSKFVAWALASYMAFSDRRRADKFEAYLKTGSGRVFAKWHF